MPKITPFIPAELLAIPRWCCWQEVPSADGKKPGKPPIRANVEFAGRHIFASCTDPATWCSFDSAVSYWRRYLREKGPNCGWSFCLNGDGIVGVDLDRCTNPDGAIQAWALEVIQRLDGYTEFSPSGNGIRIFVRGHLPPGGRHKGQIEVYDNRKFLTVTGNVIRAADTVPDRSEAIAAWHRGVFGDSPSTEEKKVASPPISPVIDPAELGDRVEQLSPKARGILAGERWGFASQSEADMSLANSLVRAGWSDDEIADALATARSNAGASDKPDSYFERTVSKAREG